MENESLIVQLVVIVFPFLVAFVAAGYLYYKLGRIKPREDKK